MGDVIRLRQLIADNDDSLYAFGFDKPSDASTPETPANLTVVPGAPGTKSGIADWDDARRAERYRIRAVSKADGEEVLKEIANDSQFVLVQVTVSGRNASGESPASDVVEFAVP